MKRQPTCLYDTDRSLLRLSLRIFWEAFLRGLAAAAGGAIAYAFHAVLLHTEKASPCTFLPPAPAGQQVSNGDEAAPSEWSNIPSVHPVTRLSRSTCRPF